jgi:hypothetical protein
MATIAQGEHYVKYIRQVSGCINDTKIGYLPPNSQQTYQRQLMNSCLLDTHTAATVLQNARERRSR